MKVKDVIELMYDKILIIDGITKYQVIKGNVDEKYLYREIAGIRARNDMYARPYIEINLVESKGE